MVRVHPHPPRETELFVRLRCCGSRPASSTYVKVRLLARHPRLACEQISQFPLSRGSSVVEQRSEEPRVVSSILTLGTTKNLSGIARIFCLGSETN